MYVSMRLELKEIPSEALSELIKEGIDILKERSKGHSNKHLKKSSDGHLNAKKIKRGPYKKKGKMTKKKIPYKENRGRTTKDFTEINRIVKEHYGKKSFNEIVIIAEKQGIKTDVNQIDNRRRALNIKPQGMKGRTKRKEQTEEEYLESVEEQSKIDLKGLNKKTEPSETPEEEYDSAESYEN